MLAQVRLVRSFVSPAARPGRLPRAYGATTRPRLVERIAEAGSVTGRGCSPSPQDRPDALHVLVLTVAGWVNRPPEDQLAYLREEQRSLRASWPGGSVGPGACPWLAASARPVAACAATAGRPVVWPGRESRRTDGRCPATRGPSARGGEPVPGGRTRALRGGASHEAEGRRGARDGRAGRATCSSSGSSPASAASCIVSFRILPIG